MPKALQIHDILFFEILHSIVESFMVSDGLELLFILLVDQCVYCGYLVQHQIQS